tara:strand:+ start:4464 stop:4736 length:273 start_codon:yes stop_codon:yes gene_type:complete
MGGFNPISAISAVAQIASSFSSKKSQPAPVTPAPAPRIVTPAAVVKAGSDVDAQEKRRRTIRRGAGSRNRVPKSVLGSSGSPASKTLLGE